MLPSERTPKKKKTIFLYMLLRKHSTILTRPYAFLLILPYHLITLAETHATTEKK